jgi:hypothetical protein
MSDQDSVLLLRRIEQAIYSLEKRLLDTRTPTSLPSSEPPVVQFPSVMEVEVSGGTVNAQIENQPIQVVVQEQPIQVSPSDDWSISVDFPDTPIQVSQSGSWSVGISDQPIQVVIGNQPIQTITTIAVSLTSVPISVSLSAAGNATLLTVPSGAEYRIYQIVISNRGSGVATFRFRDNSTPPVYYTGLFNMTANSVFTLSHLYPFITLSEGKALVIETTTAATLGGCVLYQAIL